MSSEQEEALKAAAVLKANEVFSQAEIVAEALKAREEIDTSLEERITEIHQTIADHALDDKNHFTTIMNIMATKYDLNNAMALITTKDDLKRHEEKEAAMMSKFATKDEISELMKAFGIFTATVDGLSVSGKWIYKFLIVLAVLISALAVITGAWKGVIATIFGIKMASVPTALTVPPGTNFIQ